MARLGETLLALGSCDASALERALRGQAFFGARLGTHLLRIGAVHEAHLAQVLARLRGVPALHGDLWVQPEARALLPRRLVERHGVIPYVAARRDLGLLVSDPTDLQMLDEVAFATGMVVHPFLVPESRLWTLLAKHYGIRRGLRGLELEVPASPAPPAAPSREARGGPGARDDLMTEELFAALHER